MRFKITAIAALLACISVVNVNAGTKWEITCATSDKDCYTIGSCESNITIVEPGTMSRKEVGIFTPGSPCGPSDKVCTAIFLHDPISPGTGTGYIGAHVCAKVGFGTATVEVNGSTVTVSSYTTWQSML